MFSMNYALNNGGLGAYITEDRCVCGACGEPLIVFGSLSQKEELRTKKRI